MRLSAHDIKQAHGLLGTTDDIVAQRRLLYRVAAELHSSVRGVDTSDDVLDNPAVRGHLGEVLSDQVRFDPTLLRPCADIADAAYTFSSVAGPVRLASATDSETKLAGAVQRVRNELLRQGDSPVRLEFLTTVDGAAFKASATALRDGVHLAEAVAPEMVSDLLPHIGMFAVVVGEGAGRLGSASAREYPGLVLLPESESAYEVAEAIIHEGAHQKFFDLAMTRDVFGPDQHLAPGYRPPWSAAEAPQWQLEQCFAAWHAYTHMAAFFGSATSHSDWVEEESSLLLVAAERSAVLAAWLHAQAAYLGSDGVVLLEALTGWRFGTRSRRSSDVGTPPSLLEQLRERGFLMRDCRGRTLAASTSRPTELYWIVTGLPPGLAASGSSDASNGRVSH